MGAILKPKSFALTGIQRPAVFYQLFDEENPCLHRSSIRDRSLSYFNRFVSEKARIHIFDESASIFAYARFLLF
jgi:hypothetical protein